MQKHPSKKLSRIIHYELLQTILPFSKELRIPQYRRDDSSTVIRGIAVHSSDNQSQLRFDSHQFFRIGENENDVADSFVVQSKIFRETLRTDEFDSTFSEHSYGIRILVQISTCETLSDQRAQKLAVQGRRLPSTRWQQDR